MQTMIFNEPKPRVKLSTVAKAIEDMSLRTGLQEALAPYKCILFLDFDGVIHGFAKGHNVLFCQIERIERVLRENPHVCVVFSTSWRFNQSMEMMCNYFSHDIRDRFIGITPTVQPKWPPYVKHERYHECARFMEDNGWRGEWVAIDDAKDLFMKNCPNLIVTEGNIGMTDEDEMKLDAQLKRAA